ncbi:MAG: transposase, partial [Bradymonadaceae bacterium]
TPMWCYGAIKDTVNLLGDGLRRMGRWWAKVTEQDIEEVADQWDLRLLEAASTKGFFEIDWTDDEQRAEVVDRLAREVLDRVEWIRRRVDEIPYTYRQMKGKFLKLCRDLSRVVAQNLEQDQQGRLTVAQKVAEDRMISLTDPQARHGRKSQSGTFNGFKLHLLGDAVSGVIGSLSVTPGNVHDSQPACRLVKRAKRLVDSIEEVLADQAYGGVRRGVRIRRQTGVRVLAPVQDGSSPDGEKFSKNDFTLDLDEPSARCPAGVKTTDIKWIQGSGPGKSPRAMWPKSECQDCPLAEHCQTSTSGRGRVVFHSKEEELRERREAWETEQLQQRYQRRGEGERLIHEMTRHGGRQARAWGLRNAELQAYLIAMRNNLALLAQQLAQSSSPELQRQTEAA